MDVHNGCNWGLGALMVGWGRGGEVSSGKASYLRA